MIAIYANKDVEMRLEQFKQIRSDLNKLLAGQFQIIFNLLPNKPLPKKEYLLEWEKVKENRSFLL